MKIKEEDLNFLNYKIKNDEDYYAEKVIYDQSHIIKYIIYINNINEKKPYISVNFNGKIISEILIELKEEENYRLEELESYIDNIYRAI